MASGKLNNCEHIFLLILNFDPKIHIVLFWQHLEGRWYYSLCYLNRNMNNSIVKVYRLDLVVNRFVNYIKLYTFYLQQCVSEPVVFVLNEYIIILNQKMVRLMSWMLVKIKIRKKNIGPIYFRYFIKINIKMCYMNI